jgi:hypothetical protein
MFILDFGFALHMHYIIAFICIILYIILTHNSSSKNRDIIGYGNPCIVVDLLNYIGKNVTRTKILDSIQELNTILKQKGFTEIFFVLKTKDGVSTDLDSFYLELDNLSNNLNVNIDVCYNYDNVEIKYTDHTSKGRDDFYCVYLAYKHKCKILTNDSMSDYAKARSIPQFVVRVKRRQQRPTTDVMQTKLMKIRKPRIINFNKYI